MTVSPTKREPPFGAGTPGGGFLFLGMVNLTFGIPDLSIPDSPQKSSAVQKVYKRALSVTADAVPPLPKGEALAGRATFYWTLKARYGAKGRALLQRAAASGQAHLVKLSLA